MKDFISTVFRIGLVLGALGQLKPATLYFMREAAHEQQRGLISLSALNHALWDQPTVKRNSIVEHHDKKSAPARK